MLGPAPQRGDEPALVGGYQYAAPAAYFRPGEFDGSARKRCPRSLAPPEREEYPVAIRTPNHMQRRATRILGTRFGTVNEMANGLESVRPIEGI